MELNLIAISGSLAGSAQSPGLEAICLAKKMVVAIVVRKLC